MTDANDPGAVPAGERPDATGSPRSDDADEITFAALEAEEDAYIARLQNVATAVLMFVAVALAAAILRACA